MLDLDKAIQLVIEQTPVPLREHIHVPIQETGRGLLAEDIYSRIDIPPFNRAAMDGFAIRTGENGSVFPVAGTIAAGHPGWDSVEPGKCVRIMTGASVPKDCDRVIPVEKTSTANEVMTIVQPENAHHICPQGEDIQEGQIIARKGTRLDVASRALLISCGIEIVPIFKPVKAVICSTGNELITSMDNWAPGKIFDCNGPMINELLNSYGAITPDPVYLPDDAKETTDMIKELSQKHDLICLSGGVSMGDFDFVPEAMTACGFKILFDRLLVKPGKPMTFAYNDSTVILGFPGNPVSSYLMFHIFGTLVLGLLSGCNHSPRFTSIPIDCDFKRRKAVRKEYVPAAVSSKGTIVPVTFHGSGHLAALSCADGFFIVEPGTSQIEAGQHVRFWPISQKAFKLG